MVSSTCVTTGAASAGGAEIAPFLLGRYPVTGVDLGGPGASPAVNVSWFDAVDACNRISDRCGLSPAYSHDARSGEVTWDRSSDGYRLPTDAEWQHACKAGTSGYRYGELDEIAWYADNSGGRVHDVGGKAPNAWGLHYMLGNVWGVVLGPVRRGGLRLLPHLPGRWLGRAAARVRSVRAPSQPPVVRDRRPRLPAPPVVP